MILLSRRFTRFGSLLCLGFLCASNSRALGQNSVLLCQSFAQKLNWTFNASKAQVRSTGNEGLGLTLVTEGNLSFIVRGSAILSGINHKYGKARRTLAGRTGPFRSTVLQWKQHAVALLKEHWPSIAVEVVQLREALPNDQEMLSSAARTVILTLRVTSNLPGAGHRITLILDRDFGKIIQYGYLPRTDWR